MTQSKTGETRVYSIRNQGRYRGVRAIMSFLTRLLTRFEVRGLEHIPKEGPCLFVTNHLHLLDSPIIMTAIPYRVYVFAGEKWEKHILLGPLFHSLDAIFVERGEVDRNALRKALAVLAGGGFLGVAPEGTRSKTGSLQEGHRGPAYIALRTGAKLLPMAATGGPEVFPKLWHLRRARVCVVFGLPFEPPALAAGQRPNAQQQHELTDEIMYHIAALLPPEYRGVYSDVTEKRPDLLALYSAQEDASSKRGNDESTQG
jgi:1-acyl-sn-glycerol-3-phosphate acyltransferase